MLATRAARKTRPIIAADQSCGGSIKISEIVLKDTILVVHSKAKINQPVKVSSGTLVVSVQ